MIDLLPVHRGLQLSGINGRSSDSSLGSGAFPSAPGRQWLVSGSNMALIGPDITAAGTVAGSNGIPFSFLRHGRITETNDEVNVRNIFFRLSYRKKILSPA